MENTKTNKKKIIIAVVAVVVVIAALLCVYLLNKPSASAGAKEITIEVIDNTGASVSYDVNTDAEYLADAFADADGLTVEGTTDEYGLYITTVNGLTADYEADGAYWSILVNGEYGQYGASQQPVAVGDTYTLEYTVYEQ